MKLSHPGRQHTDKRRKLLEDLIRTQRLETQDEIKDALEKQYGITASPVTIKRDLKAIQAGKSSRTHSYILEEQEISRPDLYWGLARSVRYLLHDVEITANGTTVFLYTDMGTAERFAYYLNSIRLDEQLTQYARTFRDNILACHHQHDTVIVYFRSGADGRKFRGKMLSMLQRRAGDIMEWAESSEERELVMQALHLGEEDFKEES